MKKILFVCTGNICRSPMAEGLFNNIIKDFSSKDNEYIASSAGVNAIDGDIASKNAIEAMKSVQIEIDNHRARQINIDIMAEADIILTMTNSHKSQLLRQYSDFKNKIFTIHEYVSEDTSADVADPYGMNIDVYTSCMNELDVAIKRLVQKLN